MLRETKENKSPIRCVPARNRRDAVLRSVDRDRVGADQIEYARADGQRSGGRRLLLAQKVHRFGKFSGDFQLDRLFVQRRPERPGGTPPVALRDAGFDLYRLQSGETRRIYLALIRSR